MKLIRALPLPLIFLPALLCAPAPPAKGAPNNANSSNAPIIVDRPLPEGGLLKGLAGAPLANPPAPANPGPLDPKTVYHAGDGPWGDLEYYVTYLQAPDHLLDDYDFYPPETTTWYLSGQSVDEALVQFQSLGFSAESLQWAKPAYSGHLLADGQVRLYPPNTFIEQISPDQRSALAALLREQSGNQNYINPAVIESGEPRSWYKGAKLSDSTIDAIARVVYRKGPSIVLSDYPYVLSRIDDPAEERRFVHSLTRTRTLVLRLNLGEVDSIAEIREYWTGGFKRKQILPIIESIVETPGIERLDIAHLLPPTPRKLLYTFPEPSMGTAGQMPDCYWTAANFFRSKPQDRYLWAPALLQELPDQWEIAESPFRFGDLILLVDKETRNAIHAATYIADDIVFTKNGQALFNPWILMRYRDMMARYNHAPEIEGRAYRRREE